MSDVALGIDISTYQVHTPPLKGLSFLFARASIGTMTDGRYAMHIANARKAGLVTGAYHFGDKNINPVRQAQVFLAAAGDVDFYFLDVEGKTAQGPADIRAFFAEVRKAGKRIGLYHSSSGFPELGQDYNWIAMWDPHGRPPSHRWDFWQQRGSPLDLDRYNGSTDELRLFARALPQSDTPPEDGMTTITVLPFGGSYTIPANAVVTGHAAKPDGSIDLSKPKVWSAHAGTSKASYDATMTTSLTKGNPFIRAVDGFFAGYYISTGQVQATPNPAPPSGDCSGAVGAEHERVRAAAIKAAEGL
jgi:hypothetical protein